MAIIALQGEEISASHMHAPSTAADGDDLPSHSVVLSATSLLTRPSAGRPLIHSTDVRISKMSSDSAFCIS
ncbi:hypothetical protein Y032_0261g543 [Ancylostoma ceylanicum]|nr:hypothetical protein Y032_0261g543 [Ancylostoma ceylanicum]